MPDCWPTSGLFQACTGGLDFAEQPTAHHRATLDGLLSNWASAVRDGFSGSFGMEHAQCQPLRFDEVPAKRLLERWRKDVGHSIARTLSFARTRVAEVSGSAMKGSSGGDGYVPSPHLAARWQAEGACR